MVAWSCSGSGRLRFLENLLLTILIKWETCACSIFFSYREPDRYQEPHFSRGSGSDGGVRKAGGAAVKRAPRRRAATRHGAAISPRPRAASAPTCHADPSDQMWPAPRPTARRPRRHADPYGRPAPPYPTRPRQSRRAACTAVPGAGPGGSGRFPSWRRRRQARSTTAELQAYRVRIRNSIVSLWPWDLGCLTYWVKSLGAWEEPDDLAGQPRDIGDG